MEFNNIMELLAYADDIDAIALSLPDLKEALLALEVAARRMGLVIHEEKTKYILVSRSRVSNPYLQKIFL